MMPSIMVAQCSGPLHEREAPRDRLVQYKSHAEYLSHKPGRAQSRRPTQRKERFRGAFQRERANWAHRRGVLSVDFTPTN
jgi:hypothetical protein